MKELKMLKQREIKMECDDLKDDLCMLGNCIRDKVRCCALCVDRDMCIECCDLVRCDEVVEGK